MSSLQSIQNTVSKLYLGKIIAYNKFTHFLPILID